MRRSSPLAFGFDGNFVYTAFVTQWYKRRKREGAEQASSSADLRAGQDVLLRLHKGVQSGMEHVSTPHRMRHRREPPSPSAAVTRTRTMLSTWI